jgi:hypothetical protein
LRTEKRKLSGSDRQSLEVACGSKLLKHRGLDDKTIEKPNSYGERSLEGLRPAERRRKRERRVGYY